MRSCFFGRKDERTTGKETAPGSTRARPSLPPSSELAAFLFPALPCRPPISRTCPLPSVHISLSTFSFSTLQKLFVSRPPYFGLFNSRAEGRIRSLIAVSLPFLLSDLFFCPSVLVRVYLPFFSLQRFQPPRTHGVSFSLAG